jgi:hypothetical protein
MKILMDFHASDQWEICTKPRNKLQGVHVYICFERAIISLMVVLLKKAVALYEL